MIAFDCQAAMKEADTAMRVPTMTERTEIAGDEREAYDRVLGFLSRQERSLTPYWATLLHSPLYADALSVLSRLTLVAAERTPQGYSHAERALINLVLGFEWGYHAPLDEYLTLAPAMGVRLDAIEALRDRRDERLTDGERQLVVYIRQVANGTVSDELFAEITRRFGVRGAVEYTISIATIMLTQRLYQAFDIPTGGPIGSRSTLMSEDEIDELMHLLRKGEAELPDYRVLVR